LFRGCGRRCSAQPPRVGRRDSDSEHYGGGGDYRWSGASWLSSQASQRGFTPIPRKHRTGVAGMQLVPATFTCRRAPGSSTRNIKGNDAIYGQSDRSWTPRPGSDAVAGMLVAPTSRPPYRRSVRTRTRWRHRGLSSRRALGLRRPHRSLFAELSHEVRCATADFICRSLDRARL
jgi:hypothetical protein